MRPIITIVGPTATGKTEVGVLVAKALDGEIISADSMAVYRGMDVGTAKPSAAERDAVPFHLIDVANPGDAYNVSLFKEQAGAALKQITSRGRQPILVGGTGLYVRVLLEGFGLTVTAANAGVRNRLETEASDGGASALHERLKIVDPVSAERIHPNDRVRIIRALEVLEVSGRPISKQQADDAANRSRLPSIKFGLTAPREELDRRIDARVDFMIAGGLVEEVEELASKGHAGDLSPLQSLGYKEIGAFLRGETSLSEAVEEIKRNTRRFAKRQITWFKTDKEITWIDVHGKSAAEVAQTIVRSCKERLPTQK